MGLLNAKNAKKLEITQAAEAKKKESKDKADADVKSATADAEKAAADADVEEKLADAAAQKAISDGNLESNGAVSDVKAQATAETDATILLPQPLQLPLPPS